MTPLETRLDLVKTLIVPHFLYCDGVFFPLDSVCSGKLNLLFKSCIRYIYKLRKYDHVSIYKNSILGISLMEYYKYRSTLFLYKLINGGQPRYLYDIIQFAASIRILNLIVPKYSRSQLNLFTYGVTLWNSLPISAKRAITVAGFRGSSGYF